ncbi:DMT family transporter [Aquincola sp. S2]|uniref:DMT family transporter n=1 Tax=Pseudaquabacterium terrae TaxID=2732868 RepID=A0ABX2EH61_9BURK|nr:DMT family transporter [Aquabacterium terrae]NRF67948.1 DMT family transporter [Aquabacterium terrae]
MSSVSLPAGAAAPVQLWPGLALALGGTIAFSGKAIIVKLAYRHGVDAVVLLMYRMLFALPLFMLIAWWAGRGRPPLSWRDRGVVAGLGFSGYYLASYLDFEGLQYISASLERLILYLTPTFVLVIGWWRHGRRISVRQGLAMLVSYLGVGLVFGHELGLDRPQVALGAALVLGSVLSYALYLVFSGEVVQRLGALRLTGQASTIACGLCIAQFLLLRPLSDALVPAPVLGLSLLNALACTVTPVLLTMLAIERLGPALVSQAGMVGPLSTILMGVLILGEPFTSWTAAGTLGVLAGVWLLARWR